MGLSVCLCIVSVRVPVEGRSGLSGTGVEGGCETEGVGAGN